MEKKQWEVYRSTYDKKHDEKITTADLHSFSDDSGAKIQSDQGDGFVFI